MPASVGEPVRVAPTMGAIVARPMKAVVESPTAPNIVPISRFRVGSSVMRRSSR